MSRFSLSTEKFKSFILEHKRALGAVVAVVLIAGTIIVLRQSDDSAISTGDRETGAVGPGEAGGTPLEPGVSPEEGSPTGGSSKKSATSKVTSSARPGVGVSVPKVGTIPPGVDYAKQEIKVVYYWADSSRNSQFLPPGTPGDSVDDGKAFDALVKFVNKHAKGSAQLMGTKIGMGNWIIKPTIITMNDAAAINAGTTKIAKEIKPFAAITVRGSLGTETCPAFAAEGILTYATNLPYTYEIGKATDGYCTPLGVSLDQQIEVTVNYMKWNKGTPFTAADRPDVQHACPSGCARVYGFIYSEYPGLDKLGPQIISKLRAAGLNIPVNAVASLPVGLSAAAQQAPGVRDKLAAAGVNTVIMPDGGSSLAFTHGAGNWRPDYYVWPCSGQDTTGYTRLLPPAQWDNASGLSCYDDTFDADLTIDSDDRNSQWYKAYKEMAPNSEAPSSTYLVFAALQPLVEGVGRLGTRDFTVENYRQALKELEPYRYHGNTGRTTAGDNILVMLGNGADNSVWGDLARVNWSPAAENPFSYIDGHRYKSNQSFP